VSRSGVRSPWRRVTSCSSIPSTVPPAAASAWPAPSSGVSVCTVAHDAQKFDLPPPCRGRASDPMRRQRPAADAITIARTRSLAARGGRRSIESFDRYERARRASSLSRRRHATHARRGSGAIRRFIGPSKIRGRALRTVNSFCAGKERRRCCVGRKDEPTSPFQTTGAGGGGASSLDGAQAQLALGRRTERTGATIRASIRPWAARIESMEADGPPYHSSR